RVPAQRALLSVVVTALPALAPAAAVEGRRASVRRGGAATASCGRPPRPVARARARPLPAPPALGGGLHRARPAAPADRAQAGALARPARAVRRRRRPQRTRPRDARRPRRRRARHPASGVSERARTARRRTYGALLRH